MVSGMAIHLYLEKEEKMDGNMLHLAFKDWWGGGGWFYCNFEIFLLLFIILLNIIHNGIQITFMV